MNDPHYLEVGVMKLMVTPPPQFGSWSDCVHFDPHLIFFGVIPLCSLREAELCRFEYSNGAILHVDDDNAVLSNEVILLIMPSAISARMAMFGSTLE